MYSILNFDTAGTQGRTREKAILASNNARRALVKEELTLPAGEEENGEERVAYRNPKID